MRLSGKNALVTGGSRGIGKAICLSLASEGANVAFTYRENDSLADQATSELSKLGVKVLNFKCDVRDRKSVQSVFKTIDNDWGSLDILVNNAGINNPTDFDQITDSDWDEILSVNLKGPFVVSQEALPLLEKK